MPRSPDIMFNRPLFSCPAHFVPTPLTRPDYRTFECYAMDPFGFATHTRLNGLAPDQAKMPQCFPNTFYRICRPFPRIERNGASRLHLQIPIRPRHLPDCVCHRLHAPRRNDQPIFPMM